MGTKILQRRGEEIAIEALPSELPRLLRRLYRQRGVLQANELELGLKYLADHRLLTGIDSAVTLLQQAISQQLRITVIGDFDADGATSTAVMLLALRGMGATDVGFLVPNRFINGYGLTPAVVEQAVELGTELIITVDNGISSHAGVLTAKDHGILVLITDHHLPTEQLPVADAIVNPNLVDCPFPSKSLAGVGVAFYLMLALRARLRETGYFLTHQRTEPNLASLLDLVALGTVADVVTLDHNNRIFVHQGLQRIRAGQCRTGIRALIEVTGRDPKYLVASDLSFALAPRLNAAGRLEDMSVGVKLLLAEEMAEARGIAYELDQLNHFRREIEQDMRSEAMQICAGLTQNNAELPAGLALYHAEWHQGVIGIVASRLKEQFHRPVITFAPAEKGILKGSGRSVIGLHLRDLLAYLDSHNPNLILQFGGHAMAAGLSIKEENFAEFRVCFTELVEKWLDPADLQGIIWSDGELLAQEISLETAQLLRYAGPWGQGFAEPLFDGHFKLLQQRLVGDKHLKILVETMSGGAVLEGIVFNVDCQQWPDPSVREVVLAYRLDVNFFRGKSSVQLLVEHMWPQ